MRRSKNSSRIIYDEKTKAVGKYILPLVDPFSWGYTGGDEEFHAVCPVEQLSLYYSGMVPYLTSPKLTKTPLQAHLRRRHPIHYNSNRASGFALLRLDIDAHEGQQDVWEAHSLLKRFFPCAYDEPSTHYRGWAIWILVHVGFIKRMEFNRFIAEQFVPAVQRLFFEQSITCTFEVGGLFTTKTVKTNYETGEMLVEAQRGKFGCLPFLSRDGDVSRFINAPIHSIAHLNRVIEEAQMLTMVEEEVLDAEEARQEVKDSPYLLEDCASRRMRRRFNAATDNDDAFWRMNVVCFDFTLLHGRLPTLSELLDAYHEKHGGDDDDRRVHRAESALKLRVKRYDPSKMGGFVHWKDKLIKAVQIHCIDRSSKYTARIDDLDLAIALFVVQTASFKRHANGLHQFTVAREMITSAYRILRDDSVIESNRGCNLNKVGALKAILQRARLITCLDPDVVISRNGRGISQKWVIGPQHWLHEAFVEFSNTVQWVFVKKLRSLAKDKRALHEWANAETLDAEALLAA